MPNNIVITTDSGIDPIDITTMIPGQIIENDQIFYRDVFDISSKEILDKLVLGKKFKTSSPTLGDYEKMFTHYLEQNNDIIHLSMSSGLSQGSLNAATTMAKILNEEYSNQVHVIDSYTGANGGTLISEYAKDLVTQGYSSTQIITILNHLKKQIQTSFFVPNPEGFLKSGRDKTEMCIKDKAYLSAINFLNKLNVKYRVDFNKEGNLYTKNISRTPIKNGLLNLTKTLVNENNVQEYYPEYVVIGTLPTKLTNLENIVEYLKSLNYFHHIITKDINGVIAVYGCYDLGGISLVRKK